MSKDLLGVKTDVLWTPSVYVTGPAVAAPGPALFLREHKALPGGSGHDGRIVWTFQSNPPNDYLDMHREYVQKNISGYVFFVAQKSYLHGKKLWLDWRDPSGAWWDDLYFEVLDGKYRRDNDYDFPYDSPRAVKGAGVLYQVHKAGGFVREQQTWTANLGGAIQNHVTVFVRRAQDHNVTVHVYIYGFEIRDPTDDSTLVAFDISPVTMEVSGTNHDYGYTGSL